MSTEMQEFSKLMDPKMRKLERLLSAITTVESTRNGMSSILIKLPRMQLRD